MIDCSNAEIRDLLPDLAGGRDGLSPEQRARVEAHVAACPACREELALLDAVRRACSAAPVVDVGRVTAALPRPASRRGPRLPSGGWQRAAAIALLAVGVSSLWVVRTIGGGGSVEPGADSGPAYGSVRSEAPAVALGYRLSELSEQDLESLLGALDDLDALPAVEPAPMIAPLGGEEGS